VYIYIIIRHKMVHIKKWYTSKREDWQAETCNSTWVRVSWFRVNFVTEVPDGQPKRPYHLQVKG